MSSLQLFLLLATCIGIHGYRMVAAPVGTCTTKRAYAVIYVIRSQCETMGGVWNGNPGNNEWINCHLDWCEIPASGSVSSGWAWGIDVNQASRATSDSRTYAVITMTLNDCVNIDGRYNGNPTGDEWINCHLYMERKSGTDRQNIHTLVVAGVGECQNKVAYGILSMTYRHCRQVGGTYNGNPGANDWINCHLDICISPVIECVPNDAYSPIQICRNPSDAKFTCKFSLTTGINKEQTSSSTQGGSTEISISTEPPPPIMVQSLTSLGVQLSLTLLLAPPLFIFMNDSPDKGLMFP